MFNGGGIEGDQNAETIPTFYDNSLYVPTSWER